MSDDLKLNVIGVKEAMNFRKAQCCRTCGNARINPGSGGMNDAFLQCNANVLCRFHTADDTVCDYYNGAHGPTVMEG